jgi:hypothetical protein
MAPPKQQKKVRGLLPLREPPNIFPWGNTNPWLETGLVTRAEYVLCAQGIGIQPFTGDSKK